MKDGGCCLKGGFSQPGLFFYASLKERRGEDDSWSVCVGNADFSAGVINKIPRLCIQDIQKPLQHVMPAERRTLQATNHPDAAVSEWMDIY